MDKSWIERETKPYLSTIIPPHTMRKADRVPIDIMLVRSSKSKRRAIVPDRHPVIMVPFSGMLIEDGY